ncbi:MAG: hypothetical protein AB1925_06285 [Actinomycetota bacterium]
MAKRLLVTAAAVAAVVGVALPAPAVATPPVQQPWDPGCWGPFAWGSGTCDWSESSGPSGGWDPSITGPAQFTPPGSGQGSAGSR